MSSYLVLNQTSEVLREVLWNSFQSEPLIKEIVRSREEIVFRNPTEAIRDGSSRVSVWLYNVAENTIMRNQPGGGESGDVDLVLQLVQRQDFAVSQHLYPTS